MEQVICPADVDAARISAIDPNSRVLLYNVQVTGVECGGVTRYRSNTLVFAGILGAGASYSFAYEEGYDDCVF